MELWCGYLWVAPRVVVRWGCASGLILKSAALLHSRRQEGNDSVNFGSVKGFVFVSILANRAGALAFEVVGAAIG